MSVNDLDEERRFLLGSIRDLDREHAVGDVTDDDYRTLRDGYVARAALVMREIEGQASASTPARSRWGKRLVIIGATLAVAIGLGVFVARSAGQRLPGQTLTGGQPADEVALQLAEGRRLLNLGNLADSLLIYERVEELEPGNVEAVTYAAWVEVLIADATGDSEGVQLGIQRLAEATTLDETYADPHCLLALALHNFVGSSDVTLATRAAQTCLALDPPADIVPLVEVLL